MRIVSGPPGSGKTAKVLEEFRAELRARNDGVRLLVPTATLAQHLQHRLAREGLIFRRSLIQTLSGFVESLTRDLRQVSEPVLYLLVEEAAARVNRPEFARVLGLPGFSASLARTILEFSSAGCDAARLGATLPDGPLSAAFLAVYREVDEELARRGLALRARRLEIAADRIERDGAGAATFWLDGFHAVPEPELAVLRALDRRAAVTITIAEADLDARLRELASSIEHQGRVRSTPAFAIVRAPNIERECDEIARRICEQAAAGRPFREIGIIARAEDAYVPLLRTTLERFGIPARFYFDQELERHPVVRHVSLAIEAMLAGWDHAATLRAIRLAPGVEDSNALDRFDFRVRDQMPNIGLEALRAVAEEGPLDELLDRLAGLEEWRDLRLPAKDWSTRLAEWAQSALIDEALADTAQALDGRGEIGLREYWRAAKAVIRLSPLRQADGRRDVVHVLSAHEARQWGLPVIYICGMVEKQFPQFHRQDPFFGDAARRELNARGVRIRTAEQFEREERALFDSAVTRATLSVVLSYPEFDARGERNLASMYLEEFVAPAQAARAARPAPRGSHAAAAPDRIAAPPLLEHIRQKTSSIAATALENFLQCPFQYFATRLIRFKGRPNRPEERLDFLTQGNIVHGVLAEWWNTGGDIGEIFERVFAATAAANRIEVSYQTERARNVMLDDLRKFAAADTWPRQDYESATEKEFDFRLTESLVIKGKIDRLDVTRDGRAVVIDYKYSNSQNTKARIQNENLLQAPLYLLGAERKYGHTAGAMYYVGLKGAVEYAEWPAPEGWRERAVERTLQTVEEIRSGRVEVAPADPDKCRFCDAADICRLQARAETAIGEGA